MHAPSSLRHIGLRMDKQGPAWPLFCVLRQFAPRPDQRHRIAGQPAPVSAPAPWRPYPRPCRWDMSGSGRTARSAQDRGLTDWPAMGHQRWAGSSWAAAGCPQPGCSRACPRGRVHRAAGLRIACRGCGRRPLVLMGRIHNHAADEPAHDGRTQTVSIGLRCGS